MYSCAGGSQAAEQKHGSSSSQANTEDEAGVDEAAAESDESGYDSDAGAIASLQKAVASTSGLKPVRAEARDLFRRPLVAEELRDFDAVVFDPPRQGAQAQAERLAASKVPVVIAVSCNVATFARDARILIEGGYRIEGVTPVDQFRHTPHVELVARFTR